MRGYYSMIQDGTFGKIDNPEIEDVINKISRSTTDLTMIVEDYLNISRIEQGRMQYNFVSIDIADIVNDVIKEVSPTVHHAGLTLNLNYDTSQKYIVSVDQGKIKQVIFNIIDNSIKYTPKGSINVSITKTTNKKVLISIKDTGVGIKSGVIPQLFKKFTRAPDASDTNILGTGLGLYVADQILKAHDGHTWAQSEGQDKGSQFYIELGLNE
jgi:signal transduction histidine kinase